MREVEEETACRGALGIELASTSYVDAKGRPKTVRYWTMELSTRERFVPNDEVDEVEWVDARRGRSTVVVRPRSRRSRVLPRICGRPRRLMTAMASAPSVWRPTPADPYDFFTADEVDRARAVPAPAAADATRTRGAVAVGRPRLLVGRRRDRRSSTRRARVRGRCSWRWSSWRSRRCSWSIDVPIDVWVDFGHDRRWELSTQTPATFVADQVKSFVLSTVLGLALLVPLYALIRYHLVVVAGGLGARHRTRCRARLPLPGRDRARLQPLRATER